MNSTSQTGSIPHRGTSSNDGRASLRFDRVELAGSLGDLGTFIPLLVAMVAQCGLQLVPSLVGAGLMNIITGLAFRIPMPVQPMKAIAAVAIAEHFNESQILAAGITTGAVILILGCTGLVGWIDRVVPRSVVRGLQLGLGLKLLSGGFAMIAGSGTWIGSDSIGLGIVCGILALILFFSVRVPGALVVFLIGLVALLMSQSGKNTAAHAEFWHMPVLSNASDWWVAFWRATIPQIPLTTLNSVIAVCALSADLFPDRASSPRRVAISVGLMNLICCPFGAMPMCHGAGGLAGQYRFGARTGGSVIMLGVVKIVLALVLGTSLLAWLHAYPQSVLGVLLLFSGLELSMVCRDQSDRGAFFVMLVTAGASMAINTAVGFLVGLIVAVALHRRMVRIEPPVPPA